MSEVKVNKISPRSGTDVALGDASDTFTLPASATIQVASSGEIDIASGATLDVNGTIDVTGATLTGFSDNTPSFLAYSTTNISLTNDTYTLPTYNTEAWDTDTAFASGVFTVPAGEGGKYLFWGGAYFALEADATSRLVWYKDGVVQDQFRAYGGRYGSVKDLPNSGMALFDLSETDTMSLYVYQDGSTAQNLYYAFFGGMKLIGV